VEWQINTQLRLGTPPASYHNQPHALCPHGCRHPRTKELVNARYGYHLVTDWRLGRLAGHLGDDGRLAGQLGDDGLLLHEVRELLLGLAGQLGYDGRLGRLAGQLGDDGRDALAATTMKRIATVKGDWDATVQRGGKAVRKYDIGDKALAYMRAFQDETTYPVAAVTSRPGLQLRGRQASSGVEGMNGHNGEVRGLFVQDLVHGMYKLACLEQGRFSKQHQEAAQRVHAITREPWDKLRELNTRVVEDPWKIEALTGGAFKVMRRQRAYTVTLPDASRRSPHTSDMYHDNACTCGYPLVNNMPCEHLLAVVMHRG
jgi:hypothetical protein